MATIFRDRLAAARDVFRATTRFVGGDAGVDPRFELFNAANSICSQKARCVLLHHRLPFVDHGISIFHGETYLPEYVRLRMLGCDRLGGGLVSHHSGSTATSDGGCDGAVVPTLVDRKAGEVIVDSKRICVHLDDQMPEAQRLRRPQDAEAIDAELEVVDRLPNYQMLMGRQQSAGEGEATRSGVGASLSQRKVAWCDDYLRRFADDPVLVRAYTAKRDKELSAAEALFAPEAMRAAYGRAAAALGALEGKLAISPGRWLFGERLTMADLFWGIELLRMRNVGVAGEWEDGRLPNVERFAAQAEALVAIREGIIDWPGALF